MEMESWKLWFLFLLHTRTAWTFLPRLSQRSTRPMASLGMVRNIDLPECLIFYGDAVLNPEDAGLYSLLEECKDTETVTISISANTEDEKLEISFPGITFRSPTRHAPNPKDLWDAIQSVVIQPRPFGGSAGFGSKLPDPERHPMPARTVVFCETVDQTRAARACGMRVLCFADNDLADAIVDEFDFYLDDIATPGSFWLNPPHPRDDQGNKVYVKDLIDEFEMAAAAAAAAAVGGPTSCEENVALSLLETQSDPNDEMDDDEIKRILADMAPL